MTTRPTALWLVALATLGVAACGSATTTPLTSAPSATPNPGASRNSVLGEVVAIKGATATVQAPDGTDGRFTVDATTSVSQLLNSDISELVAGACAFATGERDVRGYVVASRVVITAHGANGCSRPGGALGGSRGGANPNSTAGGLITGVDTRVWTVQGATGVDHFTAGPVTPVSRYTRATIQSVRTGSCVVARGTRDPSGLLKAFNLSIVPAGISGCFSGGSSGFGAAPAA